VVAAAWLGVEAEVGRSEVFAVCSGGVRGVFAGQVHVQGVGSQRVEAGGVGHHGHGYGAGAVAARVGVRERVFGPVGGGVGAPRAPEDAAGRAPRGVDGLTVHLEPKPEGLAPGLGLGAEGQVRGDRDHRRPVSGPQF
jgi:hypothetical protein